VPVVAALALVALAIWGYLAIGHGGFWRTDVTLPAAKDLPQWPAVAVVIPARDEALTLPITFPTLLAQDYAGRLWLVVVDDGSTDGTAAVAAGIPNPAGRERVVLAGTEPPAGWTGKLWAMQQGLEIVQAHGVEMVLFTEADIVHPSDSVRRLVAAAESNGLDAVSLMALLPAARRWERLLIPAFVYFFAQLYPFRRVNRSAARTAAAAGGCLLVRVGALCRAGGLERIRGAVIDDVALARLVKRSGGRIWLGLSSDVRSCRPYHALTDVWTMVARSAFTQLRHSYALVALTAAGLCLTYLVPPAATVLGVVGAARGGGPTASICLAAGAVAWALMAATYIPMLRHHGRAAIESLLLPAAAALYVLMTVDSAWRHWRRGGAEWKGRRYAGAATAHKSRMVN
jgi:hopene-associated glycosyltransferase HpnB